MEVKLNPQNIEETYEKGPGTAPDISNMQVPEGKEEQLVKIKAEIEDLRLFAEYNRLMTEQEVNTMRYSEAMVMMGKMQINQVPDCPFKDELIVRLVEAGAKTGRMPIVKTNEEGKDEIVISGLQGLMLRADQLTSLRYLTSVEMESLQMKKLAEEKEQAENSTRVDPTSTDNNTATTK